MFQERCQALPRAKGGGGDSASPGPTLQWSWRDGGGQTALLQPQEADLPFPCLWSHRRRDGLTEQCLYVGRMVSAGFLAYTGCRADPFHVEVLITAA